MLSPWSKVDMAPGPMGLGRMEATLSRETPAAVLEGTAHARQTAYGPRCSSGALGGGLSVAWVQCPPRSALTLAAPAQQPVCPGRPWTFDLL